MKPIMPCLWFKDRAEEAMLFYTSVFPNSKTKDIARYGDAGPGPKGQVMVVTFELNGREFMALNGGREFPHSAAISLVVHCETQEEIDHLWNTLSEGGETQRCGWLQDQFGICWQIVPTALGQLMSQPDPQISMRVMKAMLGMTKLDIAGLRAAAEYS